MITMPNEQEIARIRREALLNRAVEAYKFFYPTLSMLLNFEALEQYGANANEGFLIQLTTPDIVTLTQNSDTPYGLAWGNTAEAGPMVLELPAGPLMGVVDDMNFRFVTNMGIVGKEEGKGAKYLFLPPDYQGDVPNGYIVCRVDSYRFLVCVRAPNPDAQAGLATLSTLKFYPLKDAAAPKPNTFKDVSAEKLVADPCTVDGTFAVWEAYKRALDMDVPCPAYYNAYGMLADLGLCKGKPFAPDTEMKAILTEAAAKANEQLAVTAFANTDPARLAWPDRQWEWIAFSEGDNGYYEKDFLHLAVRERWFYQATLETAKMFMRKEGAGSLYWLGNRDTEGRFLDGGSHYTLTVPTPVPAGQFWSVTLYDLDTRSEIKSDQFKPVLTSLRDNLKPDAQGNITLYFGPTQPQDSGLPWLQTPTDRQWFAYFRIYGPDKAAFDGSWKPSDFKKVLG